MDNKENIKKEIMKGLEDIENGRVSDFNDFVTTFDLIVKGDSFFRNNDIENAEKAYREATIVSSDKTLSAFGFYKLGVLYYNFKKPDILYSRLYFELALDYGIENAAYYLATIYEWDNKTNGAEYDQEIINHLYELVPENPKGSLVKNDCIVEL